MIDNLLRADPETTDKQTWERSVIAKVLDCSLEVSEFELQSRCYVHFRTLGKGMDPFILQDMG